MWRGDSRFNPSPSSAQNARSFSVIALALSLSVGAVESAKQWHSDFGTRLGKRAPSLSFTDSSWIWASTPSFPDAPPGRNVFRRTFTTPAGKTIQSATVLVTADDQFTLFVNGNRVGAAPDKFEAWREAQQFTVGVQGSSTLFAVQALNEANVISGGDNRAGLLVSIRISFTDGTTASIVSDTSWKVHSVVDGFEAPSTDDSTWDQAVSAGRYGVAPWLTSVQIPPPPPDPPAPAPAPAPSPTITSPGSSPTNSPSTTTVTASLDSSPSTSRQNGASLSTKADQPVLKTDSSQSSNVSPSPSATGIGQVEEPKSSSSAKTPVAAIAGGAVGGVVLLALLIIFLLWRRNRRKRFRRDAYPYPASVGMSEVTVMSSSGYGHHPKLPPSPGGRSIDQFSSIMGSQASVLDSGGAISNRRLEITRRIQELQEMMADEQASPSHESDGFGQPQIEELQRQIQILLTENARLSAMPPPAYR